LPYTKPSYEALKSKMQESPHKFAFLELASKVGQTNTKRGITRIQDKNDKKDFAQFIRNLMLDPNLTLDVNKLEEFTGKDFIEKKQQPDSDEETEATEEQSELESDSEMVETKEQSESESDMETDAQSESKSNVNAKKGKKRKKPDSGSKSDLEPKGKKPKTSK